MKKILLSIIAITTAACATQKTEQKTQILTDGVKFCESVISNNGNLLVVNFGAEELNPLNTEGKGYVVQFNATDSTSSIIIPADGTLSAPKGTAIKDNYLFIADVGKMVVYDLEQPSKTPQIITFPEGEIFLNDLAISENKLYTTVTNSGNIYSLDITDPANVDPLSIAFYTNIIGANGIIIDGKTMYVASYPPDNITTEENVIYVIKNIAEPTIDKLNVPAGQYDGLAISSDKTKLYFTNWSAPEVKFINLATDEIGTLELEVELAGPARLIIDQNTVYIPDLPNSRIIKHRL